MKSKIRREPHPELLRKVALKYIDLELQIDDLKSIARIASMLFEAYHDEMRAVVRAGTYSSQQMYDHLEEWRDATDYIVTEASFKAGLLEQLWREADEKDAMA